LKLTTAGYKRPSGKNIHKFDGASETDEWGVQPSDGCEVRLTDDELRALFQLRQKRDVIRQLKEGETPPPEDPIVDAQLEKAMERLREKLGDPIAPPVAAPAAG
jgi:carboxyl-terminal processing protease